MNAWFRFTGKTEVCEGLLKAGSFKARKVA